MEEKFAPTKAYIVYWDGQLEIIEQATMCAETLWPIPLTRAIKIFRPEFAAGANVIFEDITGELSETVIFKFQAMKRVTNYCSRVFRIY